MYGSSQRYNRRGGSSSPNSVAVDTTKLYETLGVRTVVGMPAWNVGIPELPPHIVVVVVAGSMLCWVPTLAHRDALPLSLHNKQTNKQH